MLAPFGRSTWKLVDSLGDAAQAKYWADVVPDWFYQSDEETDERLRTPS